MQITGRVTADATVRKTDSGKEVVNFSIADSETYRAKDTNERKQLTTFFDCSYWFSANVAKVLKKGATVQLTGRVGAKGYKKKNGDVGASVTFNANHVKVLAYAGSQQSAATASEAPDDKNDLPF